MSKTFNELAVHQGGIRIPVGAVTGDVLTSDSAGNGTWQPAAGTIVTGTGAPTAGTGANGQLYLDLAALEVWGPKAAGAWPGAAFARLMPLVSTWQTVKAG
jgi:hypothetical protein